MKNVHVFKRMSVFSIRSFLLFALAICTQAIIGCKSDDVSPQSLSQQAQNLVKENNLRKVTTLPQSESIIYLKSIEKASQFLLGLNSKLKSPVDNAPIKTQWTSPHSYDEMNVIGVFIFPNNIKADMYFDGNGNISTLKLNGDAEISFNYDSQVGYLEATKWGIIAIPMVETNESLPKYYEYYYAPIIRWSAYLENGWSSIRYFNTEVNPEVEGLGSFYIRYSNADSIPKPPLGNYGESGEIIPVSKY